MVGFDGAQAVQADGFSCKEELLILGGVIGVLAAALVAVVKIGWNHIVEDLKEARAHEAAVDVTLNSAKKKQAESPK